MRIAPRLFFVRMLAMALLPLAMAADNQWVPFGRDESRAAPTLQVLEMTANSLDADVQVPGMLVGRTLLLGDEFATVGLEQSHLLSLVGRPEMPVIRRQIEVPRGARVRLRLIPEDLAEWSLASYGLPQRLMPAQPPLVKQAEAEANRQLVIDEDFYRSNSFWPEANAIIAGRGIVRGRDLVLVELRPISINPAQGILRTWSRAKLVVESSGGDNCSPGVADSPRLDALRTTGVLGTDRPQDPECREDAAATTDAGSGNAGGAEGMLVFVADDFAAALDPFVDWKRKTGFKVEVVKMSDLGGSPSDSDIKSQIQDAYNTWNNPSLAFVLMVGDTDFTPIHQGSGGGNSQVTDNWFVCVDGSDYLPDLAISRISTRTASETSDVVDKLMTYERATFANDNWTKRAGFIGTGDSGHISLIEDTHDYCIDTWYTPNGFDQTSWSHGYSSSDRHYNSYDADTSEISASIDEGRTIVNYSGHGSETSWQGPTSHGGYGQSEVRNNTNDGMYPFIISNACVTGTLNRSECFGETWQKEPHKGSIAFLGASNSSYWDEDDYFQRRLHANIFPMDQTPPIGVLNNRAKIDLYNHYGDTGTMAYYFDMYNMLSEPSLSLWTRRPRDLDPEYDDQLPTGSTEFTVTVRRAGTLVEGALVAVRKADEGIFSAGYTDGSGAVVLPLDPAPMSPGAMEVTITGHDDRPHEGTTEVIPIDGPWLQLDNHVVDDSEAGCDMDGIPDIGETTHFVVTLANNGSEDALETRVWLSSTADIAVLDNPIALGTIPVDGTAEASFDVRIGAGVSCEEEAVFDVSWECLECDPGSDTFPQELEVDLRDEHDIQDFEHGGSEPADWSHEAVAGADDWRIVDSNTHGGTWAYFGSGQALQKETLLVSEELHPEGEASLSFWHRYELTELKSGAYLEITKNGGNTWDEVDALITSHPYNGSVGQGLDRHAVWNGDSGGWVKTVLDLNTYSGESVRVRFHLGSLGGTGSGWWIDDLELESVFVGCDISACGIPDEVSITEVTREGDSTHLRWWDDPVSAHYRVRRSSDPSSSEGWEDVTQLDSDDTDAEFADDTDASFACWLIQGRGPDGDGPWGHYSW